MPMLDLLAKRIGARLFIVTATRMMINFLKPSFAYFFEWNCASAPNSSRDIMCLKNVQHMLAPAHGTEAFANMVVNGSA